MANECYFTVMHLAVIFVSIRSRMWQQSIVPKFVLRFTVNFTVHQCRNSFTEYPWTGALPSVNLRVLVQVSFSNFSYTRICKIMPFYRKNISRMQKYLPNIYSAPNSTILLTPQQLSLSFFKGIDFDTLNIYKSFVING